MLEKGLAKTNEDLAALLKQNVTRIRRVRRLAYAHLSPDVKRDAVNVLNDVPKVDAAPSGDSAVIRS